MLCEGFIALCIYIKQAKTKRSRDVFLSCVVQGYYRLSSIFKWFILRSCLTCNKANIICIFDLFFKDTIVFANVIYFLYQRKITKALPLNYVF